MNATTKLTPNKPSERAVTTPPALPTAFLLLAEHALVSGGHAPSVPQELLALVEPVSEVLALDNMIARHESLVGMAMEHNERQQRHDFSNHLAEVLRRGHEEIDDYWDLTASMTARGVQAGLVAGYLLARMLDGKDGVR